MCLQNSNIMYVTNYFPDETIKNPDTYGIYYLKYERMAYDHQNLSSVTETIGGTAPIHLHATLYGHTRGTLKICNHEDGYTVTDLSLEHVYYLAPNACIEQASGTFKGKTNHRIINIKKNNILLECYCPGNPTQENKNRTTTTVTKLK
jgi:hypothetical protein